MVRDGDVQEHVSKDEKGRPCIRRSSGTSNELLGSRSVAGWSCERFQSNVGTTAYLDGMCLRTVFYGALV